MPTETVQMWSSGAITRSVSRRNGSVTWPTIVATTPTRQRESVVCIARIHAPNITLTHTCIDNDDVYRIQNTAIIQMQSQIYTSNVDLHIHIHRYFCTVQYAKESFTSGIDDNA